MDGDYHTITCLAEIAGTEAAPLLRESCRKVGNRFLLRGQTLTRASLVRPGFRICPACFVEDRRSIGEPPETAAYGRTMWSVQHLRTCARHDVVLVDLPTPSRVAAHDFVTAIDGWVERVQDGAGDTCRRPVSQFEHYLIRRLEGLTTDCWLDELPFYAAARICEMTGLVKIHGRTPIATSLGSDDWADAGQQGFLIASAGPGRIERFLYELWASYPSARPTGAGPKAWFGRFYHWLEYETEDPAYDPVRDIIVRFVAEYTPFHSNERLFGQAVPYRKRHSVRTAANDTNICSKRLRKILLQASFIDATHEMYADHDITFDATAAKPLLDLCATALTSVDVASALGVGWDQVKPIVEAGYLKAIDKRESATATSLFTLESFDAFMTGLRDGAEKLTTIPDGAYHISTALRRAQCTLLDIVGLVIRRELTWVGWLPDATGFRSILVNVDEVRSRVRRRELDGYTRRQVEQYASISTPTINRLIAAGFLRSKRQRHPFTYSNVVLIEKLDVDRFCARYTRLMEASKFLGLTINASIRALNDAGITPALAKADFLTTFYFRSDIEKFAVSRCEAASEITT